MAIRLAVNVGWSSDEYGTQIELKKAIAQISLTLFMLS